MSSGHYCDGCAQAYYKCVCNKPQEKVKEQTIKMNERIKELAHKADFIGKKNNGAEWRWGYIDPELAEKLETFAELIVRECACLSYLDDSGNPEVEEALEFWRKNMLKHFGVEE